MSVTITIDQLREAEACDPGLDKLQSEYGERRTFRKPETLAKALIRLGKSQWFADHMLSDVKEYARQCNPLQAEYVRQCDPLFAEYVRQCDTLWTKYVRQCDTLWTKYMRQCAPLWAEYGRQCAPLWAEYGRQRGTLWAEYVRQRDTLWTEYDRQCAHVAARLYFQQERAKQ